MDVNQLFSGSAKDLTKQHVRGENSRFVNQVVPSRGRSELQALSYSFFQLVQEGLNLQKGSVQREGKMIGEESEWASGLRTVSDSLIWVWRGPM